MKKTLTMVLALILVLSVAVSLAEPVTIDGLANRKIKIKDAGLNPSADEMIAQNISPTTGRALDMIDCPEGFLGTVMTLRYQPIMVQVSNAGGGVNTDSKGRPATAPINLQYADVVYESCQANGANGGSLTRFSAVFSDVVPDYVGFVRSTRSTHPRIRQEWNCAFITSGYSNADVPDEWRDLMSANLIDKKDYNDYLSPSSTKRNKKRPGLVYVQNFTSRFWTKYMFHCTNISDANDHVYQLANIVQNVYPKYYEYKENSKEAKYYTPYNHTWKFTDTAPEGGNSGEIVYVTFGGGTKTDSRLEYNPDTNEYVRYVPVSGKEDVVFRSQVLVNPKIEAKTVNGTKVDMIDPENRVYGDEITFTNIIIQGIEMNWRGSERPDPVLTGTGNADYFMGGKHYSGVWKRDNYNSRTVFYGEDGNEIELLRGKTLIVLMDYNNKGRSVQYE